MRHILILLVAGYRYFISPWFGQNCRFYPSCSCYAQQALREHGSMKGTWLGIKRIFRCHPWHAGGYDPVPASESSSNNSSSTPHSNQSGNCSHG